MVVSSRRRVSAQLLRGIRPSARTIEVSRRTRDISLLVFTRNRHSVTWDRIGEERFSAKYCRRTLQAAVSRGRHPAELVGETTLRGWSVFCPGAEVLDTPGVARNYIPERETLHLRVFVCIYVARGGRHLARCSGKVWYSSAVLGRRRRTLDLIPNFWW